MARDTHSKSTDIWLLPEDEALVGQQIEAVLAESAWRCSKPGPRALHQVHLHPSVEAAMTCDGAQAFLDIALGRPGAHRFHLVAAKSFGPKQPATRSTDRGPSQGGFAQ